MKQKILIGFGVVMILAIVGLMIMDMSGNRGLEKNPYAYELDDFSEIGLKEMCYAQTGEKGLGQEKLTGICIDQQDRVFLVGSGTLMVMDKDLKILEEISIPDDSGPVHVDEDGQIYIGFGDHIKKYDTAGTLIKEFEPFGEKTIITSIATYNGEVFAADAGSKLILCYDQQGTLVRTFGQKDPPDRPFGYIIPSAYFDLAIGREGQIWTVNPGLHAFEAFSGTGRFISSWNKTSMDLAGFSGCCNPIHMAILSDGSFVTSEKGLVRVKIHEPDGTYRCVVERPEAFHPEETGIDLAVNSSDEIYLIVPSEKTIRKYSPKKL